MIIMRTHRVTGENQFWANGHWVRSIQKSTPFLSYEDAHGLLVRYMRHCRSQAFFAYTYDIV